MAKQLPRVVLVGRTNVGKSTLFNRLSTLVKSITFDQAGITRDFLSDVVSWKGRDFELIDTGGVSLKKTDDTLLEQVRKIVLSLIDSASVVLFVCDATVGILQEDQDIARLLHKQGKSVILVINKIDKVQAQEHEYEFQKLGFDDIVSISAEHATGIGELLQTIVQRLPEGMVHVIEKAKCRIVLIGKPNVGKSSLLNLLLKQERALVSDEAGTTREAITERLSFFKEDIQITDTPGLRRKRAIKEPVEQLMSKSSLRALGHADIVLLLVDASEGKLADQELKLAFYTFNQLYKGLIILFNKDDLTDEDTQYQLKFSMDYYQHLIRKVETLSISCKTGKNIGKILPLVDKVWKRYSETLSADDITILFHEALVHKPLFHKTQRLEVYKVHQVAHTPITLLVVVNHPDWFGPSQLAFFDGLVRKKFDLKGVPIKFITRKKS